MVDWGRSVVTWCILLKDESNEEEEEEEGVVRYCNETSNGDDSAT